MSTLAGDAKTVRHADSHAELRALWSQHERRRADGGWWALSGFSIQATIALDRFVRRALIDGKSDAFAFEAVSDFATLGERIGLTQVKRTLTRATLIAAVREAKIIIDLCSPAFAQKLEFQIVCERDEIGVGPADLEAAEVFDEDGATTEDLEKVVARFSPTEPVMVMTNPGLSLRRTLLSAGVRDPDRVARDALGTLFDAFDGHSREAIEVALMRALSEIKARSRSEDVVPGRLLMAEMFERHPLGSKNLFFGARPRLVDLAAGKFLDRTEVLRPLAASADQWLSGLDQSFEEDDLRLPLFWLEGRPGDGKSVLTLQLLERLIAKVSRLASVTELANTEELSAWLSSASHRDANNQAEIGFIDDLAAHVDADQLEAIIDETFYRGSPYVGLISCGTSEAAATFAAGRRVALTRAGISSPTPAELDALLKWAGARLHRQLLSTSQEGVSVTEFMVGLTGRASGAHGPISSDLRAALAVNALGLAAPRSLIHADEVRSFAAERPDIELAASEEAAGIRLAHAEAVWPLYVDAVGDAQLAEVWGTDLGRVLAKRASSGEVTEARRLLGALINSRHSISRLQKSGVRAPGTILLDAVYRSLCADCTAPLRAPLFRLWLVLAINQRLTAASVSTLREEGRQILAAPDCADDVKGEVAASLIRIGRADADAPRRAASSFLRRAGPLPAAAKYALITLSKSFAGQAAEVATDWLVKNRKQPMIGDVLARVLNKDAPPRIQELAFDFVQQFASRPESSGVLVALGRLHRTKRYYLLQDRWLAQAHDPLRVLAIFRDQLNAAGWRSYAERALKFMTEHSEVHGGQQILSVLLRKQGGGAQLDARPPARAWLDHRRFAATATPVLTELVAIQPVDIGDLRRALEHIADDAPGASSLFATLAVVLRVVSPSEIGALRRALPTELRRSFDAAASWRTGKLDARLQHLDERLRRAQSQLERKPPASIIPPGRR
jgi:hypothetical protein